MFRNAEMIAFNLYYSVNNNFFFNSIYTESINNYPLKAKEIESSIGSIK
jgi:hypothetical protein